MPRPLLPPRGVFVPSELIYNPSLSSHPLRTWIQLRGIAWGKSETPQLSMGQLQEILGKSRSTIYGHMALLRSRGALRWRPSENGTLIVSFPASLPEFPDSGSESSKPDMPAPHTPNINLPDLKKSESETPVPDSGLAKIRTLISQQMSTVNFPGESSGSNREIPCRDTSPVSIYRSLTKIKPNQVQRTEIMRRVTDNDRWYRAVEHWLAHKWNPKNIPGILDLYKRGGPDHCRVCENQPPKSQLETIQDMRKAGYDGE
ncbi:MAG: hypothetical protein ACK2TW_08770 [Anaerolineales bacterium]|jgi:hypothetical protein